MKISGFTFCRNAVRLYYPVKQSIESILPIVDEMIVVLGKGDNDDHTEEVIRSIDSEKIKIIHTEWDLAKYPNGAEYAHQTDIAKEACSGDWLFYIQSDEVVHEKYLPGIKANCEKYLNDKRVEGFLFQYKHFWGDFDHFIVSHAWYSKEIRIIRNDPEIHSWRDAQSFRRMPGFDGLDYYKKEGTSKLNVIELDAYIFHYGFVRPPHVMQKKRQNHNTNYRGADSTREMFKDEADEFAYGDLDKVSVYSDAPPACMREFIRGFDWKDKLHYGSVPENYKLQKHEKWKYKLLTAIEQKFFKGNPILNFKNYEIIK